MRMTLEERRELHRSYYALNRERIQANRRKRRDTSVQARLQVLLDNSRKRASDKGWEHNLTIDHLLEIWSNQEGRCAISDDELTLVSEENRTMSNLVSLDRIDNEYGYVVGNVWFTTAKVNYMRGMMDLDEFFDICDKIARKNK